MNRHRIEIEFDADVDNAEWLYDWVLTVTDEPELLGNVEVSMTPVVVDIPTP